MQFENISMIVITDHRDEKQEKEIVEKHSETSFIALSNQKDDNCFEVSDQFLKEFRRSIFE
jgi:hypothetical protein